MHYREIKSKKIYEKIADELLGSIKKGQLRAGDKLDSVEKLADSYGVGRSAIREALSALRAMGLLEMRQGEGTFVREFNPAAISSSIATAVLIDEKDIHDLLEVRKVLEVGSVQSAVENANEADLNLIASSLEEMRKANGDEELGEQADLHFHMSIAAASHNRMLVDLMNNVSEVMLIAMRETRRIWLYSEKSSLEKIYQEHKRIFEAIQQRDAKKAQKLMLTHLTEVEKTLLTHLTKKQEI